MPQDQADIRNVRAVQRRLLEQAGGALDTATVADLLGLTSEEVQEKARRGGVCCPSKGPLTHDATPAPNLPPLRYSRGSKRFSGQCTSAHLG